ncbi:MAG: preprotein translocase subunit SecY [Oligoflexia bacterium]|nr:preprotein translocase subunit SecY [Oligoflexia bacterium]
MIGAQGRLDELKRRILFTVLLLMVFRIAAQVPTPGIDGTALQSYFHVAGNSLFDLINTFSGGAFKKFSVLALGIMPYITTSIIFSLLTEVVPQLQELQDDSDGHKKIAKWTRYATVVLCMIQGYGMAAVFETFRTQGGLAVVPDPGFFFKITTALTLTTGTMFLLFLGERITEYGLENGVSLIVFAGIAVEVPSEFIQKMTLFQNGELSGLSLLINLIIVFASFYVVSFVEKSFRGVPVQYAKKVINNRVYGGAQTLPIRCDTGGVMPPILASSLMAAPATFASFVSNDSVLKPYLEVIQQSLYPGHMLFNMLFSGLIVYMAYFYAPIQFKTKKISEMLQRNNAFIPGIRPGVKTKEFLDFVLNRITFFSSLFLVLICVLPTSFSSILDANTRLGGTALLILVSVSIRVLLNIQSYMYADKMDSVYKAKGKFSGGRRRF